MYKVVIDQSVSEHCRCARMQNIINLNPAAADYIYLWKDGDVLQNFNRLI